jgi:hypothetical protein
MKNMLATPLRAFSFATTLALAATAPPALAQGFALEGAVIDSRTGDSLGVVTERGALSALFRAQKAMTFGILRSAGISLEQLSPDVRARIERFQTTNVEAFRAFSQGLDLKDQGKFAEAREFFKRAAELDPGFALAAEQQQSMPDVNLGSGVQTRAVMLAAAGAAVDRGKAAFVVDVARAVAAIQAGQTVITVPAPADNTQTAANDYTTNPAGSGAQYVANQVVGLSYSASAGGGLSFFNLTNPNEWRADEVRATAGVLESVGSARSGFIAQRFNATSSATGSQPLADGSVAYWGSWLSAPGASALLSVGGQPTQAPALGQVDYVLADAPRAMPNSGTAVFTPAGGPMSNVSGSIAVDFVNRDVSLQNLGFQIGSQTFAGLNGSSQFDAGIASGAFSGRYTTGTCTGCSAFTPLSSIYTGNFVGRDANGLVFSTIMITGGGGTASGVSLFTRP